MTFNQKIARFDKASAIPFIAFLTACGGGDGSDGSSFIVSGKLSNGNSYSACLNGSSVVSGQGNSYAVAQNIASYYGIYYWQSHSNTALGCERSGYALDVIFGVDFYNKYINK